MVSKICHARCASSRQQLKIYAEKTFKGSTTTSRHPAAIQTPNILFLLLISLVLLLGSELVFSQCYCPAVWDPVCGTDNNVYTNVCFLICFRQKNITLAVLRKGQCTQSTVPPTILPLSSNYHQHPNHPLTFPYEGGVNTITGAGGAALPPPPPPPQQQLPSTLAPSTPTSPQPSSSSSTIAHNFNHAIPLDQSHTINNNNHHSGLNFDISATKPPGAHNNPGSNPPGVTPPKLNLAVSPLPPPTFAAPPPSPANTKTSSSANGSSSGQLCDWPCSAAAAASNSNTKNGRMTLALTQEPPVLSAFVSHPTAICDNIGGTHPNLCQFYRTKCRADLKNLNLNRIPCPGDPPPYFQQQLLQNARASAQPPTPAAVVSRFPSQHQSTSSTNHNHDKCSQKNLPSTNAPSATPASTSTTLTPLEQFRLSFEKNTINFLLRDLHNNNNTVPNNIKQKLKPGSLWL